MLDVEADADGPLDALADAREPEDEVGRSEEVEVEAEVIDEVVEESVLVAPSVDVLVTAIELLDNQSGLDPLRPKYTDHASRPPPVHKYLAK